jgi:hypothetical protein
MATTLTEAAKYTTNMVKKGVLMEIVKDSIVMQKLPFIDVVGNAYQYLRETTLPTAEFYDPNEVWAESTGDVTQKTAALKILGGDADLDNFLKATRSDKTDLQAEVIQSKTKAVKHKFLTTFWYGDSTVNTKEFDGLHRIFLGADMAGQYLHMGTGSTGAALSLAKLDEAIDLVRDGRPDCILTTRHIRRRVMQYLRTLGSVEMPRTEYGVPVPSYNHIPWDYDDFLLQTEAISGGTYSASTGGVTSTLFILRFGQKDLLGLQNGGLEVIKVGQLESKDAVRHRIRWYVSLALLRTISVAAIDGITDATAVA